MSERLTDPVVVGVDGSPSAVAALDVAAGEALALGVPLRIAHAYVWPLFYASLANLPFRAEDWQPPPAALDVVHAAARRVSTRHPGLPIETAVAPGTGGTVLVDASRGASLVVVGARGAGGIAGLLSGAVAAHVSTRARCPVLVVRAGQLRLADGGHVAVGVDESGSPRALRFATNWAARRGASVETIHASTDAARTPPAGARVVAGEVVSALVEASQTARLVVVGAGHRGQTAAALLRRSACPLMVVPDAATTGPLTLAAPGHDGGRVVP